MQTASSRAERPVVPPLHAVIDRASQTKPPNATYRLQFNSKFTFQDARAVVPYLVELGVSHIYASPYLKARAGSGHGYDIVDHASLNPEVGSDADYGELVQMLHSRQMGQILDVVPNHMGVATNDNAWWLDVLENGPSSPYATFFDIDWMPLKADLANKVLLPVLGDQYGKVLEEGQLKLHFEDGVFVLRYYDRRFPIAPRPSAAILKHRISELEERLGPDNLHLMEYQSILTAISHLPPRTETDPERISERRREKEVIKRRLNELTSAASEIAEFLLENVRIFNGTPGDPASFDLLDQLLQDQAYRLAYWQVAADEINYRRFFDINDLAAIRMENPEVFEKTHSFILRLVDEGKVNGLRIDHPDGLFDPPAYLLRLQQARFSQLCRSVMRDSGQVLDQGGGGSGPANHAANASTGLNQTQSDGDESLLAEWAALRQNRPDAPICRPLYVVVEKILGRGERLPEQWAVHGTTGYEFLNTLNGIFVDRTAAKAFDSIYARFIRTPIDFRDLVYACKKQTMLVSMSSEIEVLAHQLDRISEQNRWSRDFTLNSLRMAIREVIACFPVYRTYISDGWVDDRDRYYIDQAVNRAKRKNPATSATIFDFVRGVLLLQYPGVPNEKGREDQRQFVGKFQQVTGPVMAKGLEDTSFYIFNRLASLNEVGGEPDKFGTSVTTFHQRNQERQSRWPFGMLPATTHDTKRSEDVRARINVLSELPTEWRSLLGRWSRVNHRHKKEIDGSPSPSRNDEYLLYQTLVGTWPFEWTNAANNQNPDGDTTTDTTALKLPSSYVPRIQQYMLKAAREAKVETSWISPHEPYEKALHAFVAAVLADTRKKGFLTAFQPFASRIAHYGIWNSLAQTLLRLTSPGVPDIYQGTELWDLTLVDPDNRQPVDYHRRAELLKDINGRRSELPGEQARLAQELLASCVDGRIKLFVVSTLLHLRGNDPDLFTTADYIPLEPVGAAKDHVAAFLRRSLERAAVVVAPRLVVRLTRRASEPPVGPEVWSDTMLPLPAGMAGKEMRNVFTGEVVTISGTEASPSVAVSDALRTFPIALLI